MGDFQCELGLLIFIPFFLPPKLFYLYLYFLGTIVVSGEARFRAKRSESGVCQYFSHSNPSRLALSLKWKININPFGKINFYENPILKVTPHPKDLVYFAPLSFDLLVQKRVSPENAVKYRAGHIQRRLVLYHGTNSFHYVLVCSGFGGLCWLIRRLWLSCAHAWIGGCSCVLRME